MKVFTVSCPACAASFPVDPEKVPIKGVNARCSECRHVFRVERPAPEVDPLDGIAMVEPEPAPEVAEPASVSEPDVLPDVPVDAGPASPTESVPDPVPSGPLDPSREPDMPAYAEEETEDDTEEEVEPDSGQRLDASEALPDWAALAEPPSETTVEQGSVDPAAPDLAEETSEWREPELQPEPDPITAPAPVSVPEPELEPVQAFTFGKRDPVDKARRLARVLVSDMVMYNAERHQSALQRGTLEEDFEEEIEKSWKEFVEQVGPDLAHGEGSAFWTSALNEILAKGQDLF